MLAAMISIREALERMMPRFSALPLERVSLEDALGRHLALALSARHDEPPFDNSAMDGYAVRASDLADASAEHPFELRVIAESRAGGPQPSSIGSNDAARIFTGAPMPAGADAVVMQEDVERIDDRIVVRAPSAVGRHVRRRGEVLHAGDVLLESGTRIGSGEIGLCASQGFAQLPVHRRPRVAILSTGDELREIGEPDRRGSIIDSNSHALRAAVREAGGIAHVMARAPDEPRALEAAVRDAFAFDVLLTCGGVSVGEYDLLHQVFADVGVEEVFWKVRIKPGKPIRFGMLHPGGTVRRVAPPGAIAVVGLPGNPVSALLTFEIFVRPALRRMLGDPLPFRDAIPVELAAPIKGPGSRTELVRVRLSPREAAPPLAHPHRLQGSAALTSLVGLDALVVLEEGSADRPAGSVVPAIDLRGGAGVPRSILQT
jgi:molybdopterin molybdotransferase